MKYFIKTKLKYIYFSLLTKVSKIGESKIYALNSKSKAGFFFPYQDRSSFDYRQLHNLHYGYSSYLLEKYTTKTISIKPSDTVIDCGAFVGGFSVAAANSGIKRLFSVEPSSRNHSCLKLNLEINAPKDIEINRLKIGLGKEEGMASLNLSKSGCDDSILSPDDGNLFKTENVQIRTLKNIINEYEIDTDHLFLKIEAEGFEPEVLEGLGAYTPRVVVVDITPERDNESPKDMIVEMLKSKGYEKFEETSRCLFAIK